MTCSRLSARTVHVEQQAVLASPAEGRDDLGSLGGKGGLLGTAAPGWCAR